jgi:hypothetical protein
MVTHMWFTEPCRTLSMNSMPSACASTGMGAAEPGVEVPLGEFFAVGQGKPAPSRVCRTGFTFRRAVLLLADAFR